MKRVTKKILAFALSVAMMIPAMVCDMPQKVLAASDITVSQAEGWFESVYAKWAPVDGATGYKAYVKPASAGDDKYVQLDNELIRQYADYWRADQVGLAAGNYVMKIEAVKDSTVIATKVTDTLIAKAYDRSGFAFSTDSPLKSATVGAYNLDGTLKNDALVVYVTENNKSTVTVTLPKDAKGGTAEYTGVGEITKAYGVAIHKGWEKRPLVIRIIGKVTGSGLTNDNDKLNLGFKECECTSATGVTIEGIGDDATIYGAGVRLVKTNNFEIRNLGFMYWPDDGIALETNNINIWIHNNDVFYGKPGSASDQVKGDGSMDLKYDSQFVTISYMHFWDSGKMSLCGMKGETGPNYITYHHNWFDHSDSRHPRIRTMSVHVYNNYYDGNSKYGVGAAKDSNAFVESNYFRNCKYPILSSQQGSDVGSGDDGKGTFSGENGGMVKAYNNTVIGATKLIYANTDNGTLPANATSFDAVEVSSRTEKVPDTFKSLVGGNAYNNFDTEKDLGVKVTAITDTSKVPEVVMASAGRVNGGDFKWTFTSADDKADAVNAELKAAVVGYQSSVKSIGGIDGVTTPANGSTGSGGSGSGDSGSGNGTGTGTGGTGTGTGSTGNAYILNASDVSVGDITSAVKAGTDNYYTIVGTSGAKVTVDASKKTCGDVTVTNRIKLGGAGKADGSERTINFTTKAAGELAVYMVSSSSSETRTVVLYKDGEASKEISVGTALAEYKFDLAGAGTYSLATTAGGLNVYYCKVTEKEGGSGSGTGGGSTGGTGGGSTKPETETIIVEGDPVVENVKEGLVTGKTYGNVDEISYTVSVNMPFITKDSKGVSTAKTIDGVAYEGYVQGSGDPKPSGGQIPTSGAYFVIKATTAGKIEFVLNSTTKTYHFVNESGKENDVTAKSIPDKLTFDLTKGETYYFYADGSKPMVYSITITPKKEVVVTKDTTEIKAFVNRLYSLCLGRSADEAGLNAWVDALAKHESSGVDAGYGFACSEECIGRGLSNQEYVNMLYLTYMDREADDAGRAAWVEQLDKGVGREKVLYGFIMSDEFKDICTRYGIELGSVDKVDAFKEALDKPHNQNEGVTMFVARCYTEVLGRGYDQVGLEAWCNAIITKDDTPRNVAANGFIFSDEFKEKQATMSDEDYLKVMYKTFLGREADPSGLSAWAATLKSGEQTRETIIDGFAGSDEFKGILEEFGLAE